MNIAFGHKLAKKSKGNREHRQQHLQFAFCCCSLPPAFWPAKAICNFPYFIRIHFINIPSEPGIGLQRRKSFFRCASMVANRAGVVGAVGG